MPHEVCFPYGTRPDGLYLESEGSLVGLLISLNIISLFIGCVIVPSQCGALSREYNIVRGRRSAQDEYAPVSDGEHSGSGDSSEGTRENAPPVPGAGRNGSPPNARIRRSASSRRSLLHRRQ